MIAARSARRGSAGLRGRVEQLVDATGTQAGRARDFADRQPGLVGGGDGPNPFGLSVAKAEGCGPESGDQLLLELHPLAQVLSRGSHRPVLHPGTRSCPQN